MLGDLDSMETDAIRLGLALVVEGFALYLAAMNGMNFVRGIRNERRGIEQRISLVPVVSLVVAYVAFAAAPEAVRWWMWLGAILDIGNWAALIGVFYGIPRAILTAKPASPPSPANPDQTE